MHATHNNLKLRLGAVSYLNTKPLVHDLAELWPEAELVFDYPSRLADSLAVGELDIALVPSVEIFAHPEWQIVSDACIACRGPVLSVKLLFRKPPRQVRALALDEGSRTSVVLAQILLREFAGVEPVLVSLPLGFGPGDVDADAVLVIGDRAIRCREEEFVDVWDLGDRWCRSAELPFVFAMWVARPGIDICVIAEKLAESRDRGLASVEAIATEQSQLMDLPFDLVLDYVTRNLHFELGSRERRGLELFRTKAYEYGLIPQTERASCER